MNYPFTTLGVADWQNSLQTFTDVQLQQEAAKITANFKTWLSSNFQLAPPQLVFFDNLSSFFVQLMSAQIAFAVINRLPVKLIKPENSMLRGTKLIRDKSKVQASEDGQGNTDANGEVVYEITYG